MLSSQLMQAWTNNTPLVFKGTLSLIAPASDGDIVLGSCALAQPITGVVPDLVTRYWLLDRSYLAETADHEDQAL